MALTPSFIGVQIFNGLVWGMVLGLIALGLSVIFGMLDVVNFAQGTMYTIGAYCGYSIILSFVFLLGSGQGGLCVALVVAPLVVALLSIIIEVYLLRPIYSWGHVYHIMLTFGLALIGTEVVRLIYGSTPMSFPTPGIFKGVVSVGSIYYPKYRLFVFVLTVVILAIVWLFLDRTKYGTIVRAGIEDAEMVNILGINIKRLFSLVFGFGAALSGVAGVLGGPILGSIQPDIGEHMGIYTFIIVVMGGLGSLSGAIVGAILLGLVKSVMEMIWAPASNVTMFILMAVILVIRPQGLMGKR